MAANDDLAAGRRVPGRAMDDVRTATTSRHVLGATERAVAHRFLPAAIKSVNARANTSWPEAIQRLERLLRLGAVPLVERQPAFHPFRSGSWCCVWQGFRSLHPDLYAAARLFS